MKSLIACIALAFYGSTAAPSCANAQATRLAVIPAVLSDTVDQRLATELRDALGRTQPHVRISTQRDLDATLMNEAADTLSTQELREIGHLMGVHVVVGVHRCDGTKACVRIVADRIWTPSSPDTLRLFGPKWVQAATDTLAFRFFRQPSGR